MKRKKEGFLALGCLMMAFLLFGVWHRQQNEAMAGRIAPEILRFHVLANSNSPDDQTLKLQVKTLLLQSIYQGLEPEAEKDEIHTYIEANTASLEQKAESFMKEKGYDYAAHIEIAAAYFPAKTYGDMTFPEGTYDAVRILLGKGKGHNWWCVLYPPLCFVDEAYAIVPDSSKEVLQNLISQDDFAAMILSGEKHPEIQVKFRLGELFLP